MRLTSPVDVGQAFFVSPNTGDVDQEPEVCHSFIEKVDSTKDKKEEISIVKPGQNLIPEELKSSDDSLSDDAESIRTTDSHTGLYDLSAAMKKIQAVQKGIITLKALAGTQHKNLKVHPEFAKEEIETILNTNYEKTSDGTVVMINKEHLKKQKKVLSYLLKQFGSAFLSGKSVMGLSLPVTIFEPRSHLERQANSFIYAPHYLTKGGHTKDALEQFKLAVTYFVSSLHILINPQKPFNPILGETFQATIDDCDVYAEQISHHPPVSAFQVVGKTFNIDATLEFTAAMSANSVKSSKVGLPKITFKNNNTTIRAQYPTGVMQGTTIGKRTFSFSDKFYIFDLENKYYTEIDFDQGHSSLLKKSKFTKDSYSGIIYKINDKFANLLKEDITKNNKVTLKFKERDHSLIRYDTIEGKWLDYLKIGDKSTWAFGQPWPYKMKYVENPLPSDGNYRLDVLYLRAGDENKSQEHKKALEEFQRNDRKLREMGSRKAK